MEVKWSRRAVRDLVDIGEYIRQHDPRAARELAARIVAATDGLAQHPEMGRPGRVPRTRELVISGTPYIVAYRVTGSHVGIARVLHGARKWPRRL